MHVSSRAVDATVWKRVDHSQVSLSIVHRHLNDILVDFESHMVPKEYQRVQAPPQWHSAEGYMT